MAPPCSEPARLRFSPPAPPPEATRRTLRCVRLPCCLPDTLPWLMMGSTQCWVVGCGWCQGWGSIYPILLIEYGYATVKPGGGIRLSKKTGHALRALMYAARFPEGTTFQIRDLAEKNGIPKSSSNSSCSE